MEQKGVHGSAKDLPVLHCIRMPVADLFSLLKTHRVVDCFKALSRLSTPT